jgi:magnesium transporter
VAQRDEHATAVVNGEPVPGPAGPADGVRVWAYHAGAARLREQVPLAEVSDLLANGDTLVWVDLTAPHPAVLARLEEECRLHPLAIEDACHAHQRPKVDEYATFFFLVFYVARYRAGDDAIDTDEVDLFIGERYLITVHQRPVAQIDESVRRWRQNAAALGHDIGALLYALLDSMVDSYFPVLDAIGDQVDEVQEAIFHGPSQATLRTLARLRRDLLQVRRVLAPEREVVNTLLRRDQPILPQSTAVYFHDIYDHLIRLIDTIDTHRDLLGTATDSYLSVTSNNLNQIMKVLTGWSIILMSASLTAGIYGMNFSPDASPFNMPELRWYFGYPMALLLMLAVGGLLYLNFRRRDWL